ncbi:MAG: hypothetical protein HY075_04085 [Deltaproteobacteria bacterium]|nr:hypothetical protein [Deltaproteobacteria bacterium]
MRTLAIFAVFVAFSGSSQPAWAWGERGHHAICDVATRLVKEPVLKQYLSSRGHMLGHVCNIPDISWRSLGHPEPLSDSAHFINAEKGNLTADSVPLSIASYVDSLKTAPDGSSDVTERAEELGSLWWRGDQFYRYAVKAIVERDAAEPGTPTPKFEEAVYFFTVGLGLLGHFVGDASQPYHNSVNYDGWQNGHGGIHSFYESVCVDELETGFEKTIFEKARPLKAYEGSVVSVLKQVSVASSAERAAIDAADKVLEPSKEKERVKARREAPDKACGAFTELIETQLARAAAQLAALWDRAYVDAGRPELSKYHSYRYPLKPDHVPVDYLP